MYAIAFYALCAFAAGQLSDDVHSTAPGGGGGEGGGRVTIY